MPAESEIAYCAGLYEGEGSVNIAKFYYIKGERRLRHTPQFTLRIAMTDKEPLDKVATIFGGKVRGPYKDNKHPNEKPIYQWAINKLDEVVNMTQLIWPYLSPRRKSQLEKIYAC